MPKIGGKRKKNRTHKEEDDEEITGKIPKSNNLIIAFIIKRGKINPPWAQTLLDMRSVMYPYTAMKLKEGEKVKI